MPYVCVRENRYLGEHDCGLHHYGDQTLRRECCIRDYLDRRAAVERLALTPAHPAIELQNAAWQALTDAERREVPPPIRVQADGELAAT